MSPHANMPPLKAQITLYTTHPLRGQSVARAFGDLLGKLPPGLAPERFGVVEPLRERFDPGRFAEQWDWGVSWEGERAHGSFFWKEGVQALSRVYLDARGVNRGDAAGLEEFFDGSVAEVGAAFALLHPLASADVERSAESHVRSNFRPTRHSDEDLESVYPRLVLGDSVRAAVCQVVRS
jgi:hypothetical protein